MHYLVSAGMLDGRLKVRNPVRPDLYLEQFKPERMYATAGLEAVGIDVKSPERVRPRIASVERLAKVSIS